MQGLQSVELSFANKNPDAVWEMATRGPVSIENDGKAIAYVLSPEDFTHCGQQPRSLGFAKDLIGDFDMESFNKISAEDMGFDQLS